MNMYNLSKSKFFVLATILFIHCNFAFGQSKQIVPTDSVTNKITYSGVVVLDSSAKKHELYSLTREWFVKAFRSAKDVIQIDDVNNGRIVGKGSTLVTYKNVFGSPNEGGNISFIITILLKDGRYKYEITDFYHSGSVLSMGTAIMSDIGPCENMINSKKKSYQTLFNMILTDLDKNVVELIKSLNVELLKANQPTKDEW